ncbi:hypothetical protein U3A55_04815 [Salarchaeum sp. III]|uniref:hypothetical protein n=1 Tax=Salarchaeum sp. III TaxID=3107927 RepID=UPI002EDA9989
MGFNRASDFETALEYTETEHADGVGFVFTDDDSIVGVDLDDCRDPETGDVDELEATLAEKNERIDTLEAEVERLTEAPPDRDQEPSNPHEATTVDSGEDGTEFETASVWDRAKGLFGSSSE